MDPSSIQNQKGSVNTDPRAVWLDRGMEKGISAAFKL